MNHWRATFLGLKQLPRELSGFEIEVFFTFAASEPALIEAQRGALVRTLRRELRQTADRQRLLTYARQGLYERKLLVMREKDLRAIISAAIRQFEAKLGRTIQADAGTAVLECWQDTLVQARESALTTQSWLWAPPAKHSTRQIDDLLERIGEAYQLGVQQHWRDQPDDLLPRYARRLASRPPSAGRLIIAPGHTIEVACLMRFSLFTNTDRLLLMGRPRVADLWRRATMHANRVLIHWADLYRELLAVAGTVTRCRS